MTSGESKRREEVENRRLKVQEKRRNKRSPHAATPDAGHRGREEHLNTEGWKAGKFWGFGKEAVGRKERGSC